MRGPSQNFFKPISEQVSSLDVVQALAFQKYAADWDGKEVFGGPNVQTAWNLSADSHRTPWWISNERNFLELVREAGDKGQSMIVFGQEFDFSHCSLDVDN